MPPLVSFHRLVPDTLMPMRADRAAMGTLPTAALQYCEAITSASAFGWYGFPPMDFYIQWDGTNFLWTSDQSDCWFPLRSEHFPGFDEVFDRTAPADVHGYAPPFLTAIAQPGVLQLWTGLMVRTRTGWSILVRPPANLPRSRDYEPYEGIIETDRWFYPLFINIRIITADRPIFFDRNKPLLQVQPLLRQTYDDAEMSTAAFVDGLEEFSERDWDDYRVSIGARAKEPMLRPGRYAADVRKRASRETCPHAQVNAGAD